MEEKSFENAAKKILESEKAVSEAKAAAQTDEAVSEIKSEADTIVNNAASEMKSEADTIVENAAANAEVLEAEAEAAVKDEPEIRLDDSTQVIDVDYINVDNVDNAGTVDRVDNESVESAAPGHDGTQSLDAEFEEINNAAFGSTGSGIEAVSDPDATQSGIDMGEREQGFDAENPQYEEHERSSRYDEPSHPSYGESSYGEKSYGGSSYGASGASRAFGQTATAAQTHRGFVTKRVFVLAIIIAMLITMLASVGITTAYTTYLNNKTMSAVSTTDDHATNYTLTKSDETLSYKSIIQKTEDSVVSITTESVTNDIWMQNYVTQGAGSGVVIESDGYIITCEHVIEGARKITVTMKDGKEYDATLVGADAESDIAVIKIDAKGLKAATYGDSSKLEVGDATVVIGNPLGRLSGTVTTGIISALDRQITIDNRTMTLLQTDASINPGNSGGGMFDASGNLIGIVEAKSTGSDIDGLGFATPINKAAKIAKDLIKNEGTNDSDSSSDSSKSGTPKIGVTVTEVDEALASQYGYAHGGLLVRSISSPQADLSGIQQGDIIFKADGKNVASMDDLSNVLAKKKAGDKLKLTVARQDGSTAELTTVLVSEKETL